MNPFIQKKFLKIFLIVFTICIILQLALFVSQYYQDFLWSNGLPKNIPISYMLIVVFFKVIEYITHPVSIIIPSLIASFIWFRVVCQKLNIGFWKSFMYGLSTSIVISILSFWAFNTINAFCYKKVLPYIYIAITAPSNQPFNKVLEEHKKNGLFNDFNSSNLLFNKSISQLIVERDSLILDINNFQEICDSLKKQLPDSLYSFLSENNLSELKRWANQIKETDTLEIIYYYLIYTYKSYKRDLENTNDKKERYTNELYKRFGLSAYIIVFYIIGSVLGYFSKKIKRKYLFIGIAILVMSYIVYYILNSNWFLQMILPDVYK